MAAKWFKTQYPGVRYREHKLKKYNNKPDRYFSIRYKINGKPKEEGLGWASSGWNALKAQNLRSELLENQRRGEGPTSLKEKRNDALKVKKEKEEQEERELLENIRFRELADRFIEWGKRNKGDWRHDRGRFDNLILPIIGDLRLKDIQPTHIEQIKNACIDKGFSAANTRHYLQTVRATFNHAIKNDLFDGKNPTSNIKFPRKDNRRMRFLSYQEAQDLLNALKKKSQDMHDIALLSLHTGLRLGECFDLCWYNIDWENEIIHVVDTKNDTSRPAFITPAVREMLLRRRKIIDNTLAFPSRDGDRFKKLSHSFYNTIEEMGWNTGIEDSRQKVVFHTLRHTFASWLAMQGESLLTIKELLGHKSIEMTLRYSHLMSDQKKEAVSKLGKIAKENTVTEES